MAMDHDAELRVPPGADVRVLAHNAARAVHHNLQEAIERALQQYGDERAAATDNRVREYLESVDPGLGEGPNPLGRLIAMHGLCLAGAQEMIRAQDERAASARAAAIEEAIGFIANGHFLHDASPVAQFAKEVVAGLRRHFALAAKPGSAG